MAKFFGVIGLCLVCFFVGYLYKDTKIKTVVKQVEVVKYYNADKVVTDKEGNITAYGVKSGEQSKEKTKEKEILNPKEFIFTADFGIPLQNTSDLYVGASFTYKPSWWVVGGGFLHSLKAKDNIVLIKLGVGI